ncbi:MAG: helix-turn-helix transcriptional regulator [Tissierellia bacterium]|nr:helix-turn-helix transcriptional regulator [Tissierellia bacterium]
MDFAIKLRSLRKEKKLTQVQAAAGTGVSLRTYKGYELGERLPRYRKIYVDIANFYNVDLNYLLTDGDQYVLNTNEVNGPKGKRGTELLIANMEMFFAGGEASEEDKDAAFLALTEAYLETKKGSKKKTRKEID